MFVPSSPLLNSHVEALIPNVMVFGIKFCGKKLDLYEVIRGESQDGISALMRRHQSPFSLSPSSEDTGRRFALPVNQEVGPHQTPNVLTS